VFSLGAIAEHRKESKMIRGSIDKIKAKIRA
jgi:hypothetical protein